jgi:hypothetical protein
MAWISLFAALRRCGALLDASSRPFPVGSQNGRSIRSGGSIATALAKAGVLCVCVCVSVCSVYGAEWYT